MAHSLHIYLYFSHNGLINISTFLTFGVNAVNRRHLTRAVPVLNGTAPPVLSSSSTTLPTLTTSIISSSCSSPPFATIPRHSSLSTTTSPTFTIHWSSISNCVPSPSNSPISTQDGLKTTIYTTSYISTQTSSGSPHQQAYTITETYSGEYISAITPPGFTTRMFICEECPLQPTITLTLPIETQISAGLANNDGGAGSESGNKPSSMGSANSTRSKWNGMVAGTASERRGPAKTFVVFLVATLIGAAVWVV